MTVTERLFNAGLLQEWDRAAEARNRERMVEILGQVELADEADGIVSKILANPSLYGF